METIQAGKGEHHIYRIKAEDAGDDAPLMPGIHYLGIDSVAWFINKESSWFTDWMASGTLDIKLSDGIEHYQAALGTYDLSDGARTAPVFDRPVLPDRNFLGGVVTLSASLTGLKQDTAVGTMLKSAAAASLGIVAGMVQTATVVGPTQLLVKAGESLVGGVRDVLNDKSAVRMPFFDFSGLEFNLMPGSIVGGVTYLLFHRGSELKERDLTVRASGQLRLPFLGGAPLTDGAWLLLRMRRTESYKGAREWAKDAKSLRGRIQSLADDVAGGITGKDEALALLKPSATGDSTLFDDFSKLRAVILNDGVLSEAEAKQIVAELTARMAIARKAILVADPKLAIQELDQLHVALKEGDVPAGPVGAAFAEGAKSFSLARRALVARRDDGGPVPHLLANQDAADPIVFRAVMGKLSETV